MIINEKENCGIGQHRVAINEDGYVQCHKCFSHLTWPAVRLHLKKHGGYVGVEKDWFFNVLKETAKKVKRKSKINLDEVRIVRMCNLTENDGGFIERVFYEPYN